MWLCQVLVFVFVFKQKTAYVMRISDWSSDVCSSDLLARRRSAQGAGTASPVGALDPASVAGVLRSQIPAAVVRPSVVRSDRDCHRSRPAGAGPDRKSVV